MEGRTMDCLCEAYGIAHLETCVLGAFSSGLVWRSYSKDSQTQPDRCPAERARLVAGPAWLFLLVQQSLRALFLIIPAVNFTH